MPKYKLINRPVINLMQVKCRSGFMSTKPQIISHCCKSKYASQNTQLIISALAVDV